MKLSIVIVNYNVKYILEQCLHSVQTAIQAIEAEVFVVDNNSIDGSCIMIREKFPWVHLIANTENVGFSKANNQAIRLAKGEYVLLLNPDTVVQEDTFTSILQFMDAHPQGGGLGVNMIDGKGAFLPESKRGLPTLKVSFFKMFGLHKLFPHSKRFNYYYLGHLPADEIHEIEILSGAFMLLRSSVLDEIGLLDEEYFMYGEDIDLSYRIIKAGYKNYYYPHTTIIHYKGESTKKASFKYVLVFYKAMEIFARKQLNMKRYSIHSLCIHIAIWARAFVALFSRICVKLILPFLDTLLILIGFIGIARQWSVIHFGYPHGYPQELFSTVVPLFTVVWVLLLYFSSAYERPSKITHIYKGLFAGFIAILLIYSVLPEVYRYSRAVLFLVCLWNCFSIPLFRLMFNAIGIKNLGILFEKNKKVILVGDTEETNRVFTFMQQTLVKAHIVGSVSLEKNTTDPLHIGTTHQLEEIVRMHKINEIVFCLKDLGAEAIITNMLAFTHLQVDFKIAPPESLSVIGSNSSNSIGELYTIELNSIVKGLNKRKKRIFDIVFSLLILVLSPITIWLYASKMQIIQNCVRVLRNVNTWVGFSSDNHILAAQLPQLLPGIVYPGMHIPPHYNRIIEQLHVQYAKDYKIRNDIRIIFQNFRKLDSTASAK